MYHRVEAGTEPPRPLSDPHRAAVAASNDSVPEADDVTQGSATASTAGGTADSQKAVAAPASGVAQPPPPAGRPPPPSGPLKRMMSIDGNNSFGGNNISMLMGRRTGPRPRARGGACCCAGDVYIVCLCRPAVCSRSVHETRSVPARVLLCRYAQRLLPPPL